MSGRHLLQGFAIALLISVVMACSSTPVGFAPAAPIAPRPRHLLTPTAPIPIGVDYGLKRQCIRTTDPADPNFYFDSQDCPSDGNYPTTHYWTTAVAIPTCVPGSAMLINGPGSAVSETWRGDSTNGYTVDLKTDYANVGNLCAAETWTWVPLMDNWAGGGPLPRIDQLLVQFRTTYRRRPLRGNGEATRAFAGVVAHWLVAHKPEPILQKFSVEIAFYIDEPAWRKKPGTPPDVINYKKPRSSTNEYYCMLWGEKLGPQYAVELGKSANLRIKWLPVLQHLIVDEKLFPAPVYGWRNSGVVTTASFVGTEVANGKLQGQVGGPTADLRVSNFRESELSGP
jgi:hypothetical protein